MTDWKYFKDTSGNIWAHSEGVNYGLIGKGWFEGKFVLRERPTIPKNLTAITEQDARSKINETP